MEDTYRVLYNACYGGFDISNEARKKLIEYGLDKNLKEYSYSLEFRSDPIVLKVFDELGAKCFGKEYSNVEVEEVPTIYAFAISEYDGFEEVILKPRKQYLRELMSRENFEEVLEYLEKANCLRE